MAKEREVVVYTMPGWPACLQVKEFLSQGGVPFEERDVMKDRKYYHEVVEDLGLRSVPVTLVDGQVVVGFDRDKLQGLLKS